MRTLRIYELDIAYPEGADPVRDGEWEESGTPAFDGSPGEYWVPRWPQQRRFLSRSGAVGRAERLTERGCAVDIRRSEPIVFEDDPVMHLDPKPPTPEPELKPVPWADDSKPF